MTSLQTSCATVSGYSGLMCCAKMEFKSVWYGFETVIYYTAKAPLPQDINII